MLNFWRMAWAICRQDLQERFAGSALGGAWIFIWPLVQLFIYIVIFGRLMGARLGMAGEVYAYGFYIASGLLAWTCFAGALGRCVRCFLDKRHIINKVPVNLAIFPAAACLAELVPFAAGLVLLLAADLSTGWRPSLQWCLLLAPALYCLLSLAFGLGLFLGCVAVFIRDAAEAAAIALQMAFWFTPIVYLQSILPDWLAAIIWLNPMVGIVRIFQQCFVLGGSPDWGIFFYSFMISQAALMLGFYTLKAWRKDMLDAL